ncbi:uncharacterized protein LOC34621077 [Cyclospora cayetanensis]|uniref:Uncharacterized protein LOC34621077 n=2 Tax=Cyclospora cayetanensis TaxID=88456 RepID=A0A6P5WDN9_9EIME|nr:uncharacterized protein LOC34621077 [Cyclospora cayetanensis]OEH75986.1 ankyrin repeat domain-containing protein [Cyclospora cayetanensis]
MRMDASSSSRDYEALVLYIQSAFLCCLSSVAPQERGSGSSLLLRALASSKADGSQGSESALKQFIASARNEDGRSLLHMAAAADDEESLKLLLDCGVDPLATDECGFSALHVGCSVGSSGAVSLLLAAVSNAKQKAQFTSMVTESGGSPLLYAASKGHLDVVELLLHHGVDINTKGYGNHTAISRAVSAGRKPIVTRLLAVPGIDLAVKETGSGDNLLHLAVSAGRADIYWEVAQMAPQLENEKNAAGLTPVGGATHEFMKALEKEIKQTRTVQDACEDV